MVPIPCTTYYSKYSQLLVWRVVGPLSDSKYNVLANTKMQGWGFVIWVSLSGPNTSVTALHTCVYACLLALVDKFF